MKVILTTDVTALGKKGDIKDVSGGYARNFLFPKKLAQIADDASIRSLQKERQSEKDRIAKKLDEYKKLAEALKQARLTIILTVGKEGQAFGSVSRKDVADELARMHLPVEEGWIELTEPLKQSGGWDIGVALPHGLRSTVKVIVEARAPKNRQKK